MILDATVIVSLLADEPGASAVEGYLDGASELAMSDWNRAEALDFFLRRGTTTDEFDGLVDRLGIEFVPVTRKFATFAAEIRSVAYHRTLCPVSLADCLGVALALDRSAVLLTSDDGQTRAAELFSCGLIGFLNSSGAAPLAVSIEYSDWANATDRARQATDVGSRHALLDGER